MNLPALAFTLVALGSIGWLPLESNAQTRGVDDLYRVEVVIFEHLPPTKIPTIHRAGMQLFAGAQTLSSPVVTYHQTRPKPAPLKPQPLALSDWVAWLETQALDHANTPFIGPIAPVRVSQPQIDFPLTKVALLTHSARFSPALQRITQSGAYRVLAQYSWYQWVQANTRAIRIGNYHSLAQQLALLPWKVPDDAALQHGPLLDGQLRLTKNRFFSADLEIIRHWPANATHGPLAPEWLSPTGFAIERVKESRVIAPDTFIYFDHPSLGVLMRIEKAVPSQ